MCGIFFYCFNLAWRLLSHTDLHVGLPLFAIAVVCNVATLSVYTYAVKLHEVLFFGRGPTRTQDAKPLAAYTFALSTLCHVNTVA